MRLAPLLATLMLLALPGSAVAAVTRAESVLPPGQSGFISQDGTTKSPHLYDQVPLYAAFQWKPAMLGLPGQTEVPRAGVTIARDAYGVPSVTGVTVPDAWWGAGYAVAQDRLTELELFRRQASGRVAELLGASRLAGDIAARRDYYTPAELDKMLARLPADLQARIAAYRDGVNAWIQHVRATPQDLPVEFKLFGIPLTDWTSRDTASIGVLLARTVPSSDGNELPNARTLRGAGAKAFDSLVPLRAGSTSIVPRADGLFPSQPGRTRQDEQTGAKRSRAFVKKLSLPSAPVAAARADSSPRVALGGPAGSIVIAARHKGTAFLYSAPQLGFAFPELFVELEVHAPGLDIRGATAPGVPVVAVGHNKHLAWGVTSGESDDDDLYAETLVGDEGYRYKGKTRAMSCRDETFAVSGAGPDTERLCRTRHGPVQDRSGKFAYARRYAIWGRELDTFVGLDALNSAADVKGADRAVAHMSWNENITVADDGGNIGYWHPGLLQIKPRQWDERLPFPGTGEAEWRGFLSAKQRPHVINPSGQDWLANWNNQPSAGWTEGDIEAPSRHRAAGPLHRGSYLATLVPGFAKKPSLGRLEALVEHLGTTAQQRPLVTTQLRAALKGSTGAAHAALQELIAWDGSFARTAADGTVDPGVAIWEELKSQLVTRDQARLGGASQVGELRGRRAAFHVFDVAGGEAHALLTLGASDWRKAAAAAAAALATRFGTSDLSKWRQPRSMVTWTLQGAGAPPAMPFFERGTWEQFVELR